MESKIMIDINYASREPQIIISQSESDDPRDKLVSMFAGQAMPGVQDGYCRIERCPEMNGTGKIAITPIHPVDLIDHIPIIARFAEENIASDTSAVPAQLRKIIDGEYQRLSGKQFKSPDPCPMVAADDWCVKNLPHDLYKKWTDEIIHPKS